jgi:hypothetical protein
MDRDGNRAGTICYDSEFWFGFGRPYFCKDSAPVRSNGFTFAVDKDLRRVAVTVTQQLRREGLLAFGECRIREGVFTRTAAPDQFGLIVDVPFRCGDIVLFFDQLAEEGFCGGARETSLRGEQFKHHGVVCRVAMCGLAFGRNQCRKTNHHAHRATGYKNRPYPICHCGCSRPIRST